MQPQLSTLKALKWLVIGLVSLYGGLMIIMYLSGGGGKSMAGYGRGKPSSFSSPFDADSSITPSLINSGDELSSLPVGLRIQSRQYSFSESNKLYHMMAGYKLNAITDVTVMIKTMDRSTCLKKLISDILLQHSNITILVADDGQQPSLSGNIGDNVKYFRMPADSGLSAGRNLMLSQVQTPYLLLLDDDFLWDSSAFNNLLLVMEFHPYLDIVGGRAGLDYSGLIHVQNQTLYLLNGSYGNLEGTDVFNGKPCEMVDFLPSLFLARTESLLNVMWHNALKVGEHEEFFLRFHSLDYKAAFCPGISLTNQRSTCSEVKEAEERHAANRDRSRVFIKQGLNMHNLSRIAYCLGEDFAAPTWDRVFDLPDYECFEVPLPKDCPTGWVGEKCDECKPGFYGPKCEQCDCQHGVCEPIPPSSSISNSSSLPLSYFRCVCTLGWAGNKCQSAVVFSDDLIKDPNFSSMNGNSEARWVPFQDACDSVGDDGLWLINDGQLKCGVSFTLHLNQAVAGLIKIEGESMSIGVETLEKSSAYSIYVILTFNDGTTQDTFLPFSPTIEIQHKELLFGTTMPVKRMTIYVLLRTLYGSAFFQNVTVKTQIP